MVISDVLQIGFRRWLTTLGYADSTIYCSLNYVQSFFFYLKKEKVNNIESIDYKTIQSYYYHLQTRKNKSQGGGLSQNYIISNLNALKRFSRYLQETGKPFFEVDIKVQSQTTNTKIILTQAEIQALYNACDNDYLGIRDRAMLSIYYGCGLRRSEGIALQMMDVQLKERRVFVRKGKFNKERYVPLTSSIANDFENYIYVSRSKIASFKSKAQEAFLLSMQAKQMHGNSVILRLQQLANKAKIDKSIGLHTLRHSIATHLLQSGILLEEVSQFLGHESLESTQIYTHISKALK